MRVSSFKLTFLAYNKKPINSGFSMNTDLSHIIFNRIHTAFVHYKLIFDENGQVIDLEIIEANPAYKELTGLQQSYIEGERASRLACGLTEEEMKDLLNVYEDVALNGKHKTFEYYFDFLAAWFKMEVFSPGKDHIIISYTRLKEDNGATSRDATDQSYSHSYLRTKWLNDISRNVLAGWSASGIIDYTVKLLSNYFPEYRIAYNTINKQGELTVVATSQPKTMPDITGLTADLKQAPKYLEKLKYDEPVIIHKVKNSVLVEPIKEALEEGKTRAILDVPLVHSDHLTGLLCFDAPFPHNWARHEIDTLKEISDYLTLVLRNEQTWQALKENEQYQRAMVEASPLAIISLSLEGYVRSWNKAAGRIFGWNAGEVMGRKLSIVPEDKEHEFADLRKKVMQGNAFSGKELKRITKDGHPIDISVSTAPMYDAEGYITGIMSVIEDITERKKDEHRLYLLNNLYHILNELNQNVRHMREPQELFEVLCRNLLEHGGYEGAWIGMTDHTRNRLKVVAREGIWDSKHSPDHLELNQSGAEKNAAVRAILSGSYIISNQQELHRAEGKSAQELNGSGCRSAVSFPISVSGKRRGVLNISSSRNDFYDEEIKLLAELAIDLSYILESIEREEALRKSEAKFKTLFASAADAIFIHDLNGRFLEVNQAACDRLGYTREELLRLRPGDIDDPEYAAKFPERMEKLKQNGHLFVESVHLTRNGASIPVELNSRLIRYEDKPAILTIARDISKRKAAEKTIREREKHLQELNAEKDKFFSIIAHDLRSPFNAFLGYLQFLEERFSKFSKDQILEKITILRQSANNLFSLLENLLEWSHLQRGITEFQPETIQLGEVVDESVASAREQAAQKDIELSAHIPETVQVKTDRRMLSAILRNLTSNAIKFTPGGGRVSIGADPSEGGRVKIYVQDTGIGMNEDMKNNLFRLDAKVNRPGTEGEASTGLGLLLCKEFIEKHGGTIQAESRENEGTTFIFSLPAG
ncbi:MAG: PAS domain S-box protein [Bacteroidales bacterium]|nr:PAS domain S-box protein [Bacteroidales bacterium]